MEVERSKAKKSHLARSRSKFMRKEAGITKAIYGKEITVKLSYSVAATTGALTTIWGTVYPMVSSLQSSNDWASYAGAYQLYNLNKVKVQYIPSSIIAGAASAPTNFPVGMAYSTKDANALTNINQIPDHTNYTLIGLQQSMGSGKIFFKFSCRPKVKPPLSTTDTTEAFGWLKAYSYPIAASKDIGLLIFTFTVTFSAEA